MGRPKPTARQAFDLNIADAEMLVALAKLLDNQRKRSMRRELRERYGDGLKIPKKKQGQLECLDNEQVFVIFKPGYADWRGRLTHKELRPLLRQALVAACAAVETFCADRVMELYAAAIRSAPAALLDLAMSVREHLAIKNNYKNKPGQGLRAIVEKNVWDMASPAPDQINKLFKLVGIEKVLNKVDGQRQLPRGTSREDLARIYKRRNQIAHRGDRAGRGRAEITVQEVQRDLACIAVIIDSLDKSTRRTPPRTRRR